MAAFPGDSERPMSKFPPLSRDHRRCRLEVLHFFGGGGVQYGVLTMIQQVFLTFFFFNPPV